MGFLVRKYEPVTRKIRLRNNGVALIETWVVRHDIRGAGIMENLAQTVEDIVCEAGAVFSVLENEHDVSEAEKILYQAIEKRSTAIKSTRATHYDMTNADCP